MPGAIKTIAELGRPMRCDELDSNWLALRDRANHVGTQSASTIYDLAQAVAALPSVQGLTSSLTQITNQISDLQNQVLGQQGHVATSINILRSELTQDISDLRTLVNQHTVQINGLLAEDTSINNRINALQASLTTSIDDIEDVIDCVRIGNCLLVPRPPDNQGDLLLGYDDETNSLVWGLPLRLFCGPFIDQAFPVGTDASIQLGTFIL